MIRSRKGFTLIELLIVVVIIGILASIAIPKFGSTKTQAQIGTLKADLRNLATAQETYFAQFNTYADATISSTFFQPSANVTVGIDVGAGSWIGTASYAGVTTKCSLTVGGALTTDGAPICF